MVIRSLELGHSNNFLPFETSRNSLSTLYKLCKASIKGVVGGASKGKEIRSKEVLTKCTAQKISF